MQNEQHSYPCAEDLNADQVIVLGHAVIETDLDEPGDIDTLARFRDCLNELP